MPRRYIEAGLCITPKTRIGSERQDESRLQRESRYHERGPAAQQGLPRKGQAARATGAEPVRPRGEARGGAPDRVAPPAGRHRFELPDPGTTPLRARAPGRSGRRPARGGGGPLGGPAGAARRRRVRRRRFAPRGQGRAIAGRSSERDPRLAGPAPAPTPPPRTREAAPRRAAEHRAARGARAGARRPLHPRPEPAPRAPRHVFPRFDDNARVLRAAYRTLADDVHRGEFVTPAAEWLLDNFHLVDVRDPRRPARTCRARYYRELPKLASRELRGHAAHLRHGRRADPPQRQPARPPAARCAS